MKWLCFALFACTALAQDITFTNRGDPFTTLQSVLKRVATFTNLQSGVYSNETKLKTDLDGFVWREGAIEGRIYYTNLIPALLEAFGFQTNRMKAARTHRQRKAFADTKYRVAPQVPTFLETLLRTNRLADEKLRGLTEFTVRQIENSPEKIKSPEKIEWAERGWMDATFVGLDASGTQYPELQLAFTVRDNESKVFRRCRVDKFLGNPADVENKPPNPLVETVMALNEGDRVRLIGSMHVNLGSYPGDVSFTIESLEPLKP